MRKSTLSLACAALAGAWLATPAQAADVGGVFDRSASWLAAVGAGPLVQTLEGYTLDANMANVEVLPGTRVTADMQFLRIFNSSASGHVMFGYDDATRLAGTASYTVSYTAPYNAVALDIGVFESALPPYDVPGGAVTDGTLRVNFADGDQRSYAIAGGDGANLFFGIVADTPVTSVQWFEALEDGGINEETTLDNLRVAQVVPEPPSALLMLLGSAVLLGLRRRPRE